MGLNRHRQSIDLGDRQTRLLERWRIESGLYKVDLVRIFIDYMDSHPDVRGDLIAESKQRRLDELDR